MDKEIKIENIKINNKYPHLFKESKWEDNYEN